MISRFVQFKKLSQNDIKNLQKTVLKNDAKMMTKNIEKWTNNGAKIRKNDLQKSMRKLVRKNAEKASPGAERGTLSNPPRNLQINKINYLN